MNPMATPRGFWHHAPAALPQAGMRSRPKPGGGVSRRPDRQKGDSGPGIMPRPSAIAVKKVLAAPSYGRRHRQPSGRRYPLLELSNGRQCRLRLQVSSRDRQLRASAVVSLSPVPPARAYSPPKYLQALLVGTEEPARLVHRVSAAKPAARAVWERILRLPRLAGAVLLPAGRPGDRKVGAPGRFCFHIF